MSRFCIILFYVLLVSFFIFLFELLPVSYSSYLSYVSINFPKLLFSLSSLDVKSPFNFFYVLIVIGFYFVFYDKLVNVVEDLFLSRKSSIYVCIELYDCCRFWSFYSDGYFF